MKAIGQLPESKFYVVEELVVTLDSLGEQARPFLRTNTAIRIFEADTVLELIELLKLESRPLDRFRIMYSREDTLIYSKMNRLGKNPGVWLPELKPWDDWYVVLNFPHNKPTIGYDREHFPGIYSSPWSKLREFQDRRNNHEGLAGVSPYHIPIADFQIYKRGDIILQGKEFLLDL